MKRGRAPRLSRPAVAALGEPILPLIDVVFFLLVFALLIGRMDATAPFEVSPPVSGGGTDLPGGGLTVAIAADGSIARDGQATDRQLALSDIGARLAADPSLPVRVQADRNVALRHVLPLVTALKAEGAGEIVLVVTPGGAAR